MLSMSLQAIFSVRTSLNKHWTFMFFSVQGTSGVITLQMPKELLHHEQRVMARRLQLAPEEEEKQLAEEQFLQRKATIDHNFQAHSQLFREKYAYVPPATQEPTPLPPVTQQEDTVVSQPTDSQQ